MLGQTPAVGDRVRIIGTMPNDPAPIEIGTEGTVTHVSDPTSIMGQIYVDWEPEPTSGQRRSLILLPADPFTIIARAADRHRIPPGAPHDH